MMVRSIAVVAAFASLVGCATAKTTYLPDGRPGISINCSGTALSWDMCYQKAGKICGRRGYEIIAQNGESGAVIGGGPYAVYGGTTMSRTLLIGCRTAKPAE